MSNPLLPGSTIGIVGGGQLGQMIAMSAKEMGFHVGVLDPEKNCPAAQVCDWSIVAAYDDNLALMELSKRSDILTYEFENVSVESLINLLPDANIPQGTDLLAITQDRLLEKAFLEEANVIIAPYETINHPSDIQGAIERLGYPCVLKTTRGGYDGKGQIVLKSREDVPAALNLLREGTCELESWIPFEKELSVLVAGNGREYVTFPVVENTHRNNILHETIAPARVSDEVSNEAIRVALVIAEALNLRGILAVEMFLTETGSIYVNELAPRPHNSGHYTMEVCTLSQFDAHVQGICGWPLGGIMQMMPAVMVNILGSELQNSYRLIDKKGHWHFHYYGKETAKVNRKMGHITIPTFNIEETLTEIEETKIWN